MNKLKTLLLKFAGPLQSWGTDSHFESRYTDFYPSKSAVVGMLAASLGYRRNEDNKISRLNNLEFAIRVDQRGNLLRDYQTAKKQSYKNAYVTNRYYLEDAIFVVAISGEKDFISEIKNSLENPYFQQYLGRRSVPIQADFILKITDEETVESLTNLDWQASEWYKKSNKNKKEVELDLYADAHLLEKGNIYYRRDKVRSFSQKNRQFDYRGEKRIFIKVLNDMFDSSYEEHDVFSAVGGEHVSIKS